MDISFIPALTLSSHYLATLSLLPYLTTSTPPPPTWPHLPLLPYLATPTPPPLPDHIYPSSPRRGRCAGKGTWPHLPLLPYLATPTLLPLPAHLPLLPYLATPTPPPLPGHTNLSSPTWPHLHIQLHGNFVWAEKK